MRILPHCYYKFLLRFTISKFYEDTIKNDVKDYPAFALDVKKDSSGEKFILFVDNPKNERLAIQIHFPDGGLYNDWISCPTFRKRYDLANLDDGIYTVTVSNYKKELSRSIQLRTKTEITRQIFMN